MIEERGYDAALAALAAANEHADRLAEALRAVPHWRLVSFITGLPDDPPQCEGGCPGCAADKALAEHEARKGAGSAGSGTAVPEPQLEAPAGRGRQARHLVTESGHPSTLAAVPKIIESLRLSPDPATRADAERLAEAYQRELRSVDALRELVLVQTEHIDKLAEALRELDEWCADVHSEGHLDGGDCKVCAARALLAHLGLEGGERG